VFRTRVEGIGQLDFQRGIIRADRWHRLQNCSVIHYTRRHPMTHEVAPVYRWQEIRDRYLTNDPILSQVEEHSKVE
jgi:hypothetical protein